MKKRLLALSLALCLALTGCAAMLERSYSSTTPHEERPVTAEDPSVLRVEDYRELVSAVLYLVSQGAEEGTIQLHSYAGDEETDLAAACLEVATQDPLGAYAVDYIKHELSRVVSYYQATLAIRYRRTPEQVRSMVRVTGSRAIRDQLQKALAGFDDEVVLRAAYFAEDEGSLSQLIRQAYYDDPATALGMPSYTIDLYPAEGRERVVEIQLTYPEDMETLRDRREALSAALEALEGEGEASLPSDPPESPQERAEGLLERLRARAAYDPDGGSTAYHALVEGAADGEGMALGYLLLAQRAGLGGELVSGTLDGESRCWLRLDLDGEALYLDPAREDAALSAAGELFDAGYRWPGGPEEAAEPSPEPQGA